MLSSCSTSMIDGIRQQSCFTWIFFILKGGIKQSHVSDCIVTPTSSSAPLQLLFWRLSCQAASQPQSSWLRLHIHDIWHQSLLYFHFTPPAFLPLSTRLCCFTICHHNNTLIAENNTVMRTLMDVLNMHLIPNCEGGDLWATLIQSERIVEGNNTLWMLLLLSLLLWCWFLRF